MTKRTLPLESSHEILVIMSNFVGFRGGWDFTFFEAWGVE